MAEEPEASPPHSCPLSLSAGSLSMDKARGFKLGVHSNVTYSMKRI